MYQEEAEKIYNSITNNGEKELTAENLSIIGVVVTGEPSELQKYNNIQQIRGATLGATVDKY
ncbi:anti sigma factor C-terminal domain-containing protein [Bacillus sp. FJAT-47783]|uniref:anti sigma factor C-terminal domain-containing protein n=1 Tax=Bacillus sp. FJAT-47783 TaxID=2922712 RepID=UPI001FACA11D|nr:anti sigma factor C-terminal domain-containing protein [Bacillus sp. FJAT-47783]